MQLLVHGSSSCSKIGSKRHCTIYNTGFTLDKFGWSISHTDKLLLPVLRRAVKSKETPPTAPPLPLPPFSGRGHKSKRLRAAITRLTSNEEESTSKETGRGRGKRGRGQSRKRKISKLDIEEIDDEVVSVSKRGRGGKRKRPAAAPVVSESSSSSSSSED
uniref:Uncharacterized protein n=1 Tax=Amphimedon queenslandica TaxID=400682 RepID=A0A1X7UTB0_AMPQE